VTEIVEVVADGLSVLVACVAVYMALGIGWAFLQGQMEVAAGRSGDVLGGIMQRIALLVVCLVLIVFVQSIAGRITAVLSGDIADAATARRAILEIGAYFMDIIIGGAAVLLAVGIATGFVGAQFAATAGQALQLSEVLVRLLMVAFLGAGALLTITIANMIVRAIPSWV